AVTLGATGAWTTVVSQSNVAFAFELMCTLTVPGKPGTNCSMNSVGTLLIGQANNAANPTLQTVGAQWATPLIIGAPQTAVALDGGGVRRDGDRVRGGVEPVVGDDGGADGDADELLCLRPELTGDRW